MTLPAHELKAFAAVAQTRNFTAAATRVNITQPALSQRIQSLERLLGLSLFIRSRRETRLTDAGARLLRYCQTQGHLESELLQDLGAAPEDRTHGRLRVWGYSTVMQSVIVPALAGFLRENPLVQFEFSARETRKLPGALERGEADFIVLDEMLRRPNIEARQLGHERYVLIRSRRKDAGDVYLDHDPDDLTTASFLRKQGRTRGSLRRCYMDDIQGILTGVALGLGQAVVPRHLLSKSLPVRVVPGLKPLDVPVVLHYFRQPYYSRLQRAAIDALACGCSEQLEASPA